jgi:hypothetical protein
MTWLLLAAMLHMNAAKADNFPFQLQDVYLDYQHETTVGFDPVLQTLNDPNVTLNNHLDLHLDLDVFKYFYWNNKINTTSDQSNFRVIGWEYALGVRLFPFLEAGYFHHSQHILDMPDVQHFPLENAIQIKLIFYDKNPKESLF